MVWIFVLEFEKIATSQYWRLPPELYTGQEYRKKVAVVRAPYTSADWDVVADAPVSFSDHSLAKASESV